MSRNYSKSAPKRSLLSGVVPVSKGGTGSGDLDQVALNLSACQIKNNGLPGKHAVSDISRKVKTENFPTCFPAGPTLSGPRYLYSSQVTTYQITNYDALTVYDFSCSHGEGYVNGDIVYYRAAGFPTKFTLTVNGKSYNLEVKIPWPNTPTLSATTKGSNASAIGMLTSSIFDMVTGPSTHHSSDWQVATDVNFSNIVFTSVDDTSRLLYIEVPDLDLNTTYYTRTRHRSSIETISDWSATVLFTTRVKYTPSSEVAKVSASDKAANDNFGVSLSVNQDGSKMIVGSPLVGNNNNGAAYVYTRTGTTWSQQAKLVGTGLAASDVFGTSVAMTASGDRVIVGAPLMTGTVGNSGAVFSFSFNGSAWVQESIFSGTDSAASDAFGTSVSINYAGTVAVVGASADVTAGQARIGSAYIFTRSGATWTQEGKIFASDGIAGDNFGKVVSISGDGTRVFVGNYLTTSASVADAGAVYVFTKVSGVWTQEARLSASDANANAWFGYSIDSDPTGSRIVIGAPQSKVYESTAVGKVYVFSRTGTTWTQEADIIANDRQAASNFGASVSISDASETVLIGANLASHSALANAGGAYIFNSYYKVWTEEISIKASDKAASDNFGNAVALSNDGNYSFVAAYLDDFTGAANSGSVYVFT